MKTSTRLLLTAAALATVATTASAQFRVDRSGATDANRQVGSNGRNTVVDRPNSWDVQNNIVYGNVTGGKQFRGNISSFDPQSFRQFTGSDVFDNFVRSSSGVTTGGVPTYNSNQTRAYYGDSRGVAPPAGYVGVPSTGGYSPPVPSDWKTVDPRLGTTSVVNRPGDLAQPGAIDNAYAPTAVAAQPFTQNGSVNGSNLSDYTNLNSNTVSQLTPAQIKQIQSDSDVSQVPGTTPQRAGNNPTEAGSVPQQAGGTGVNPGAADRPGAEPGQATPGGTGVNYGLSTSAVGQAGQAPANGQAGGAGAAQGGATPLNDAVDNAVPAGGSAGSGEYGLVTRMRTQPGQKTEEGPQQSNVGLPNNQAERPGQGVADANRQYNAALRARQNAQNGKSTDGAKAGADKPDANGANNAVARPAPGKVAGPVAGLGDLLTQAADQVKAGKYATAVDTYNAAEALAPGNAQVSLGRAQAELGGAFYRKSATTLRRVAKSDLKVLATQTDLRNVLGDDRLTAVQKDLSDLVQKAPALDDNAALLLSYVYYNTGNERRATALLDLADQRTNRRDPLIGQLKAAWGGTGEETK